MTISTIATLQTAFESWAERSDVSASLFLEWANAAARKLMHGVLGPDGRTWVIPPLRTKAMLATTTLSTSGGSVAVPADWLEFERLWISSGDGTGIDLTYVPLTQFRTDPDAVNTGTPRKYTLDGATLYVAPTTDTTLQASYYNTLGSFTGDASTDDILTAQPEVYLSGVLCEFYRWSRDVDGLTMELAELGAKVRGLNAQDLRAQTSGSLLVARVGAVA